MAHAPRSQRESAPDNAGEAEAARHKGEAEALVGNAAQIAKTHADLDATLGKVDNVAKFADSWWCDPMIGLIPFGVGDVLGSVAPIYIIGEGIRAGIPKWYLVKMVAHLMADVGLGAIPILGDAWDFYHKANKANARIFREWVEEYKKKNPIPGKSAARGQKNEQHILAAHGAPHAHEPKHGRLDKDTIAKLSGGSRLP